MDFQLLKVGLKCIPSLNLGSFLFYATDIGGEGPAHELFPLSLLGFVSVASVLEVLKGGAQVLDIILELVHTPFGAGGKYIYIFFNMSVLCDFYSETRQLTVWHSGGGSGAPCWPGSPDAPSG